MGEKFTIKDYVRWSDVDYAGLICYGAYLRFFEFAETELFRAVGMPYGKVFEELDIWLPRVHLECDFHRAPRLDDLLADRARRDVELGGRLLEAEMARRDRERAQGEQRRQFLPEKPPPPFEAQSTIIMLYVRPQRIPGGALLQ